MIAIDLPVRILIFPLASKGPSTHDTGGEFGSDVLGVRGIAAIAGDQQLATDAQAGGDDPAAFGQLGLAARGLG